MSISDWSPLKRAKSTVGVPLTRETVCPMELVALMLSITTAKEVTLATGGASVPTTNDAPVVPVAVAVDPEPQPTANKDTTASERRQTWSLKLFLDDNDAIGHFAFCALHSLC